MIDVVKNLKRVEERIARAAAESGRDPKEVTLVAISKYTTVEAVEKLAAAGHRDFGENRVQAGLGKLDALANSELRWHLVGRIQTNKIKHISPFFLIQSLDRWDLAEKMSAHALRNDHLFHCLVQVNVAADPVKAGISLEETEEFLNRVGQLEGLRIRGLMTITALDAAPQQTQAWYESLAAEFKRLKESNLPDNARMDWLSMGMSDDFELAISVGANMVRVGSAIFCAEGE